MSPPPVKLDESFVCAAPMTLLPPASSFELYVMGGGSTLSRNVWSRTYSRSRYIRGK